MEYQKREDLILPEYGRNIQRMVDYMLTIEDRDKRTKCAHAIINAMGNLFPFLKQEEYRHKLWDHLAIMANFRMDIDCPYDVIKPENLVTVPNRIEYNDPPLRYRHYGRLAIEMIRIASETEDENERLSLLNLTANYMKQSFIQWNRDDVSDERIVADINEMSKGKLSVKVDDLVLRDIKPQYATAARMQHQAASSKSEGRKRSANNRKKNK